MDEERILKDYNEGINSIIGVVNELNIALMKKIENLTDENKELIHKIDLFSLQNSTLEEENSKLMAKIKELEARLNKDSNNSSKPPSSDGLKKKKKVTNNRHNTERKTGGQEGHKGVTLNKTEVPDTIVDIPLQVYSCDCGCNLLDVDDETKTRQVYDILLQMVVTEYIVHSKKCQCGKVHSSEFPLDVTQPVQYGNSIKALMSLLTTYHFIPLERASELIEDLFGRKPSEGTIVNTNSKLSDILEIPVNTIKEQIKASPVVHFDESGFSDNAVLKWMHVASTDFLTYYEMHKNRGYEGATSIGILPGFTGTAVHDHWMPYYKFTDCTHSECNVHVLRYLRDIHENYGQEWAQTFASMLLEIKKSVYDHKESGATSMPTQECETWLKRYHSIITDGYVEDEKKSPTVVSAKTGKKRNSKALQLLNRLNKYDIEHLAFMYDFDIPFDNNLSERDIRMQKLRQKISGSFRGVDGAKEFCRIRSYISTARKNGIRAFDAIKKAFAGEPFVPSPSS